MVTIATELALVSSISQRDINLKLFFLISVMHCRCMSTETIHFFKIHSDFDYNNSLIIILKGKIKMWVYQRLVLNLGESVLLIF